jgi:hypothetical protein
LIGSFFLEKWIFFSEFANGGKQWMNHLYFRLKRLMEITESEEYNISSREYPLLVKKWEALIGDIRGYLEKTASKEEIEVIIQSDPEIVYILPVGLVFDLFHQVFRLGSLDKEVIIAFACFIYAYGPDWDEESKRIKEYVAENKLKEAVNVALSVKND